MSRFPISRRTVLKGIGTTLALPLLECMAPSQVTAAGKQQYPNRMAFLYVPNGKNMADWTPKQEGTDFELPLILEPLAKVQKDLCILTGLTADKARPNGDGGGDHARANAAFLTGCQPRKTDGADINVGQSVDQAAAERIGHLTRFPSLELGIDRGNTSGNCDSGYSCAYQSSISWRGPHTPTGKEVNPRLVFERLFGDASAGQSGDARARRDMYRRSILDFVQEDAAQLRSRVGATDRRKVDEYLTSVREIELRLSGKQWEPISPPTGMTKPDGVPKDYADHIRLMCDLMVLAFQGDLTRICTFAIANDGSNRSYPFIGVSEGHHELSHHGGNKDKQSKIAKINRFHVTQFAYLLEKLKSIPEGNGTLLDHAMIAYGSGISDGDRHNHDDLPIVLAGGGCGTVKPGRHIRYRIGTPLNNLWLSMLDRMGASVDRLGDSTASLKGLDEDV